MAKRTVKSQPAVVEAPPTPEPPDDAFATFYACNGGTLAASQALEIASKATDFITLRGELLKLSRAWSDQLAIAVAGLSEGATNG